MIKADLAMGLMDWGLVQRAELIRTGQRKYRIFVAHDCEAECFFVGGYDGIVAGRF